MCAVFFRKQAAISFRNHPRMSRCDESDDEDGSKIQISRDVKIYIRFFLIAIVEYWFWSGKHAFKNVELDF
jgi:hypothetical protein